jgi:hypothetical protein
MTAKSSLSLQVLIPICLDSIIFENYTSQGLDFFYNKR